MDSNPPQVELDEDGWELHRGNVIWHYLHEEKTLKEVMLIMKDKYNFDARYI